MSEVAKKWIVWPHNRTALHAVAALMSRHVRETYTSMYKITRSSLSFEQHQLGSTKITQWGYISLSTPKVACVCLRRCVCSLCYIVAEATYGGLHQESLTALVSALALFSEGGPAMGDLRVFFRERIHWTWRTLSNPKKECSPKLLRSVHVKVWSSSKRIIVQATLQPGRYPRTCRKSLGWGRLVRETSPGTKQEQSKVMQCNAMQFKPETPVWFVVSERIGDRCRSRTMSSTKFTQSGHIWPLTH